MKLKFLLLLASAAPAIGFGPAPAAPCCAADPPSAAAALSSRSVYQLEAVWTDDAGAPVSLKSLRGRPVVVAMFFANCAYACPIIVDEMKRIRSALKPDVRARARFLLVSFDSERDTPSALRAYRERAGLEAGAWEILRGQPDDIRNLAMVLGVGYAKGASGQYAHSNLITVLNDAGEIVHQRTGLQGDVAEMAGAVAAAAGSP